MRWLRYTILACTVLCLILLFVSLLPAPRQQVENVEVSLPELGNIVTVSFDYPEWVWLATSDSLNLTTHWETATGAAPPLPSGTAIEVTLDSLCLQFEPPGDSLQAIIPATIQRWRWELTPMGPPRSCDLTLVIGLRQPATLDKQVIYVRKLPIETMSFAGLPVTTIRIVGFMGSIAGTLILAFIQIRSIHAKRKLTK